MHGIIRKELSQYFRSFTGYVYLAIFWPISGFYFVMTNIVPRSGDIKEFFSAISTVLLFVLPILTMRLFTEEKKQRTDELLLTAPVPVSRIITGKFIATMLVLLIASAVFIVYAVILAALGSLAPMDFIGNYLGFILMSCAFLAIGLFVSVLSDNQLVSAIVTYAVLLLFYTMDSLEAVTQSKVLTYVIDFLSLQKHYVDFTYGILDPANIIYFLSLTALFLFLSVFALEKKRLD